MSAARRLESAQSASSPVSWLRRYPLEAVEHAIRADDCRCETHRRPLALKSGCFVIPFHGLDHACVRFPLRVFGEDPELPAIRSCCRAMAGDDGWAYAVGLGLRDGPTADVAVVMLIAATYILVSGRL